MALGSARKSSTATTQGACVQSGTRRVKAVKRSKATDTLQAKLKIGEPNDRFEREADTVADRIMQMPESATNRRQPNDLSAGSAHSGGDVQTCAVQRQDDEEETAQTFPLQRQVEEEEEMQPLSLQRQEEEEEEMQPFSLQRQEEEEEEMQPFSLQRQEDEEEEMQPSSLQRQEEEEEEMQPSSMQHQEEEQVQAKAAPRGRAQVTPRFESRLRALKAGGGRPLDAPVRTFMEARFGRSFENGRVHTDGAAGTIARQTNARAFTVGRHLVFGRGQYRPNADQGRRLIAHELTHVLQQRGGLHSVQRDLQAKTAEPPQQADSAVLEALRDLFRLRPPTAPPSVLSIAVDMLRQGLASDAEAIGVLTKGGLTAAKTKRTLESASYRLNLIARQSAQGVETSWKLTDLGTDGSFSSSAQLVSSAAGEPLTPLDDQTVSLPAAIPRRYSDETIAAELADRPRQGEGAAAPQGQQVHEGEVPEPRATSTSDSAPAGPAAAPAATPAATAAPASKQAPPAAAEPASETNADQQEPQEEVELPPAAPTSPKEDPQFQSTIKHTKRARKSQSDHTKPKVKGLQTMQGGHLPVDEQGRKNDRVDHLRKIGAAADKSANPDADARFTPETFKKLFAENVAKIEKELPKNESGAKRFKRNKPIEKMKEEVQKKVAAQNQKVGAGMSMQVKIDSPPSIGKTPDTPGEVAADPAGKPPAPIKRKAAAPKPKADWEISMAKESASLDKKMTDEDLTEEQLAESNEPEFVKTLETKREAQRQAAEAPNRYREQETKTLAGAQGRAAKVGKKGLGGMFDTRQGSFSQVFATQTVTVTSDQLAQRAIHAKFEGIYNQTKTDVNTILDGLATRVEEIFSADAEAAKKTFEKKVEDKLDDIYGITVIDDWLFGEDTEAIEKAFAEEKRRFLRTMNFTIERIARIISWQLNAAIARIRRGKKDQKDCFDGLDKSQQKLAKGALDSFTARYEMLEESVHEKQKELAESLSSSYVSNVKSLRESFDKIKEEVSRGWIGGAIDAIVAVATTIKKLGKLLWSIISRIGDVIGDILRHPIRFLENLGKGISAGFKAFTERFDDHLLGAFFDWIKGSVGGPGIQMPDKFDGAGIFSLVTQVLSLSFGTFKTIAQRVWGKAAVALLEKGEAVAEKGLEVYQIVKKGGIGALWTHIKELISSKVDEIFEKIKTTVLYETIKKVLAFVATLFNPIGAFIKAVQAIYAGIRFLVDNIDRIAEIVNAFLSSVELAVKGQVSAISGLIVKALKTFLVVAIDFLAKLLRLGKLDDKVRRILKTLRKPIERGMEWLARKLHPLVRKLMAKFGKKKKPNGEHIDSKKVVGLVAREMKKPTKAKTPSAAIAEKTAQARELKSKYQPMLKLGRLKIEILDKNPAGVEKDADVDFRVSVNPELTSAAPVPLEVEDRNAVQKRIAKARTLKKFTGKSGFTVADWGRTFKMSAATHAKDLQFGVENKVLEKRDGKFHFESEVPRDKIVNRGATEVQAAGEGHAPFKGRFGIPLIQAFLSNRKIAGVPPDSFGDRGIVSDVASKAEGAGAIEKVGRTSTWALPEIPARRRLPSHWRGADHVRPKLYEKGAGWPKIAKNVFEKTRDEVIKPLIKQQIENDKSAPAGPTRDRSPWQEMHKLELTIEKPKERFSIQKAKDEVYYERGRYDVDHTTALAKHWNKIGHNVGGPERQAATRGDPDRQGLSLMEQGRNSRKGSGGVKYQDWVTTGFSSPDVNKDDHFHIVPGVLFGNWEKIG